MSFTCTDTAACRIICLKSDGTWHFQSHYRDIAEAKQQLKGWQSHYPESMFYLTAADPLEAMFSSDRNPPAALVA